MYLFDYKDYKKYLNDILDSPDYGRGARSRLARYLGTQSAFVAQVLKGHQHFSSDHAEAISVFLKHNRKETLYFFYLHQKDRAGTNALRQLMEEQMQELRTQDEEIKTRLNVSRALTDEDQYIFHSSWTYAAIHTLYSIPKYQDPVKIAEALKLNISQVLDAIDMMLKCGLLISDGTKYKIGHARTHLGSKSPLLKHHHNNWRMQAMKSMDLPRMDNIHFSGVYSLSEEDSKAFREEILFFLDRFNKKIVSSKEEVIRCLNIDFFDLLF